MPATASARQVAERLLQATIGPDPGEIADCYAPAVVIEMPFAVAPLYPDRIETTRETFSQRFVTIMTVRDGQIVHSRDYTNPVTGAKLLGKLPELVAALSDSQPC